MLLLLELLGYVAEDALHDAYERRPDPVVELVAPVFQLATHALRQFFANVLAEVQRVLIAALCVLSFPVFVDYVFC